MTIKFPKAPRYSLAKKKAIDLIVESQFCIVPISPSGLIWQHFQGKIKFSCYSTLASKSNKPIDYVCKNLQSDDGVSQYVGNDRYIIIYNDTITSNSRINFTIAHELGHIVLGHHLFEDIDTNSLTDEQHDLIEKEANAFAAELLAPTSFSKILIKKDAIVSSMSMQKFYGISRQCAEFAYKNLVSHDNIEIDNYRQKELFIKLCSKPNYNKNTKTPLLPTRE